ncbi:MAG: heparinase II/III-family protein, partial [Campylobacterales bacterium]
VGEIGASYIPGHAHADTFNFEFRIGGRPFIVDVGTSTYEAGEKRDFERSTKAHNIVEINSENSSEVWGGFRVANRARVTELVETIDHIKSTHDGYKKKFGILHTREWVFEEEKITINDSLNKRCNATARLHFHPDITEEEIFKRIKIQNSKFRIQNYNYATEFNKTTSAICIETEFFNTSHIEITTKGIQ